MRGSGFVAFGELNACVGHLNTTLQESAWVAVLSQRGGRNFSKTGQNYGSKEDKLGSGCFKHEAAYSFLRTSQQGLHTGCLAWFLKKNRFCKVALLFREYTVVHRAHRRHGKSAAGASLNPRLPASILDSRSNGSFMTFQKSLEWG